MSALVAYVVQLCVVAVLLALAVSVYLDGLGYLVLHVAALAGVSAYVFAITTTQLGWPTSGGLLGAVIAAAGAGLLASEAVHQLRGDGLTLATFGIGVAAFEFFRYSELTGGVFGIGAIPAFVSGDAPTIDSIVAVVVVAASAVVVWQWRRSVAGKVVAALRMDEWAGLSIGAPLRAHQRVSGLLSGGLAGLAGVYLASTTRFIEPRDFQVASLLVPLAAVIVAGRRTPFGVLAAASGIVVAFQTARFFADSPVLAGPVMEILVALLLAAALMLTRLRHARAVQAHG